MADYEEENLMDLVEDVSPVAPTKLRRLKKSGLTDLEQKPTTFETLDEQYLPSRPLSDPSKDRESRGKITVGIWTHDDAPLRDEDLEDRLPDFASHPSSRNDYDDDGRSVKGFENHAGLSDGSGGEEHPGAIGHSGEFCLGDGAEEEHIESDSSHEDGEEENNAFGHGSDFSQDGRESRMDELESEFNFSRNHQGEEHNEIDEGVNHDESLGTDSGKGKRKSISEGEGKAKKRKKGSIEGSKACKANEVSASAKRKSEKEGKAYHEQLHAESQRLLRESTDVSFKPVASIKKPVFSLLEKIRRRKLQLMRRNPVLFAAGGDIDDPDEPSRNCDHVQEDIDSTERNEYLAEEALPVEAENAFRPPLDDTQDILCDSPLEDEEEQPKSNAGISQEEVHFSTSLLAMNLEIDFVPQEQDNESFDEEDDKENIDPTLGKSAVPHLPEGDPVKAFVDDEAAEEYSDDDSLHYDDEEERENLDEELKDLIANADEEMAVDREKRDMLHQKWLQEQDAAATDNLMQRLKCNLKPVFAENQELSDESDDDMERYSTGEGDLGITSPRRMVKKTHKKPKLDFFTIFPDREDVYVSSDEEKTVESYLHQLILERSDGQVTVLSTEEDENSREVFERIKKLNIAPNNKKRPKVAPSLFDSLVAGVNSNSSSRASFLGRGQSNSLKATTKQGGSMVRSFIFGRDDSNSRSRIQTSDSVNSDQRESLRSSANESMKVGPSQSKVKTLNGGGCSTKSVDNSSPGLSLFEILRRSTLSSDKGCLDNNQKCSDVTFDAFKTVKSATKIEKRFR